jgi:hypothetical protein
MHYKIRAMEKILTSVCSNNSFSQRPVLERFKQISVSKDWFDGKMSAIDAEMKNIEAIYGRIKSSKQKNSSFKVRRIMNLIERQIMKGLELYLLAWDMLGEYNKKKNKTEHSEEIYEDIEDNNTDEYENEHIYRLLELAEDAEVILIEAEKLMVNSLNDYPLEV